MSSRTLSIQTNEQIFCLKINLIIPPPWQHTLLIIRSYRMVTPSKMNYQLLEDSCSECGMLLRKTIGRSYQDLFTTSVKEEECPKCGSILKTLKKEGKHSPQPQQLYDKESKRRSLASQSPVISSKFQTAYDEFISRLTFDIAALDSSLQNLNTDGNTLAIIGNSNHSKNNRKFTNILLTRLCIYSLSIRRRQEGCGLSSSSSSSSSPPSSPYVVIVDAGNSLDFYQFVEFIRQYGLDIKETLQRIVVSRAFTVHQLTNLIISELPNIIRPFETCLIIVPDLLHMFTHDPNIDPKEATYLIKEIISAIRKIATPSSQTRCVVSWNYHYQSSSYNKILLPTFDKYIQVTSFGGKSSSSSSFPPLSIKINHKMGDEYCSSSSCDNNRHRLLQVRDIYFVPQRSR
jgi:hypothetical protein